MSGSHATLTFLCALILAGCTGNKRPLRSDHSVDVFAPVTAVHPGVEPGLTTEPSITYGALVQDGIVEWAVRIDAELGEIRSAVLLVESPETVRAVLMAGYIEWDHCYILEFALAPDLLRRGHLLVHLKCTAGFRTYKIRFTDFEGDTTAMNERLRERNTDA